MDPETVWSRRLADELWSGVVTPLTFSLLAAEMAEHMARRRLANAGLDELAAETIFKLHRGHVFVNASLVARAMRELPAPFVSDGLLALLPEELRAAVRGGAQPLLSLRVARTVLSLIRSEREWLPWDRAKAFHAEAARVVADLGPHRGGAPATDAEIARRLAMLRERLGIYLEVVSWGVIYAFVFFHLTSELLDAWADGSSTAIAALLSGLPGVRTFEIHDELVACAEVARLDPHVAVLVRERDAEDLAALAERGELGELGRRAREVVERHGHRLLARDLSFPTWRERPAAVFETIKKLVAAGVAPDRDERGARSAAALERVLARLGVGALGPVRRAIFMRILSLCREYYALRENMRYHADLFLAALRETALAAGVSLARRAALECPEDVFYLTIDELSTALGGTTPAPELAERARATRDAYAGYRVEPPPELFRGEIDEPRDDVAPVGLRLCGLGASPGRASGPARVVRSLEELEAVREGEIVVAPATDPSWTSLLTVGRALVLEMGGPLSHGAIVARELGIPAVVDVRGATGVVRTGEVLTVDGALGTVEREARAPAPGVPADGTAPSAERVPTARA